MIDWQQQWQRMLHVQRLCKWPYLHVFLRWFYSRVGGKLRSVLSLSLSVCVCVFFFFPVCKYIGWMPRMLMSGFTLSPVWVEVIVGQDQISDGGVNLAWPATEWRQRLAFNFYAYPSKAATIYYVYWGNVEIKNLTDQTVFPLFQRVGWQVLNCAGTSSNHSVWHCGNRVLVWIPISQLKTKQKQKQKSTAHSSYERFISYVFVTL